MRKIKLLAIAGLMTIVGSSQVFAATATCWCKVSKDWLQDKENATGVLKVYQGLPTYSGTFPMKDDNRKDCASKCTAAAYPDTNSQAIAALACNAGAGNGTAIHAWHAVGTKNYSSAHKIGVIQRGNAVYKCEQGHSLSGTNCSHTVAIVRTCPKGWAANLTNVDGGVTTDGQCKRQVPGCVLPPPFPAQAAIAGYGFTWNNAVIQFGNAANGGAAVASCPAGYNASGNNCVKSYAATLVSPAFCKF